MYQSGYLTIKGYYPKIKRYRLGIPNEEVKKGLFNVLLPYYIKCRSDESALKQIDDKKYDRKYQMDGRQIIRIGVNFSSDTRCIEDWLIQKP